MSSCYLCGEKCGRYKVFKVEVTVGSGDEENIKICERCVKVITAISKGEAREVDDSG